MTTLAFFTRHRSAADGTAAAGQQVKTPLVRLFGMLLALSCLSPQLSATELPEPTERVVLSVTGQIQHTNVDDRADFDYQLLQSLPQSEIHTDTPWTKGVHVFSGVLLSDMLERVGAEGDILRAIALNDYHVDIPLEGLRDYPVLLATHQDGKLMRIRDKGPVWIILPLKDYPVLNTKKHHEAMVWQLRSLDIR